MSLQLAAQHLSNQGRGPDDTLVHMSRDEVKSLNDLAMAHGGQLTINPQTGLPEAGFLSAILPMVAGAALGPAGLELSAMQAGLAVGAGSYLLNPKAGLMGALSAGLGGYGGAQLGAGLEKLGTSEAGQTVQNTEKAAVDEQMKQLEANRTKLIQDKLAAGYNPASWNVGNFEEFNAGQQDFTKNLPQPYSAADTAANRAALLNEYQTTRGYVAEPGGGYTALGAPEAKIPTGFEAIKQGIGSVMEDPSKLKQVGGGSWTGLASTGLAALAPAAPSLAKPAGLNVSTTQQQQQVVPHYRFDPGMVRPTPVAGATGTENTYFNPKYTALTDAEAASLYPGYPAAQAANGGLMGYAAGGPVEQMSNAATTGQNTMYPMSNMVTSAFATPYQSPTSTNMLSSMAPSGGGTVDAMSGEPNMQGTRLATGGIADLYSGGPGSTTSNTSGGPAVGTGGYSGYASPVDAATAQQNTDSMMSLAMPFGIAMAIADAINGATTAPVSQGSVTGTSLGAIGAPSGPAGESSNGMGSDTSGESSSSDARGGYLSRGRFDQRPRMATGGISDAGYNLGGYSDGGRLLRGPGDGVSDSIPATIGHKQPARLADGEFVVPARIVSELGNGSTEAGARKLYAMMDRVQAARKNTVGKGKVAKNNRADRYLPA